MRVRGIAELFHALCPDEVRLCFFKGNEQVDMNPTMHVIHASS